MSPKEVIAVFGEVPKRPVISRGGLGREVVTSELWNVKPMTKLRRERYLRSWQGMVELLSATVRTNELWSGDFKAESVSSGGVRKERDEGAWQRFL